MSDETRESRVRRLAKRRGLKLEKSRRRDARFSDFGMYRLVDESRNEVVAGGSPYNYSVTLDWIEDFLSDEGTTEAVLP